MSEEGKKQVAGSSGGGDGDGGEEVPDPELDSLLDGEEDNEFVSCMKWHLNKELFTLRWDKREESGTQYDSIIFRCPAGLHSA